VVTDAQPTGDWCNVFFLGNGSRISQMPSIIHWHGQGLEPQLSPQFLLNSPLLLVRHFFRFMDSLFTSRRPFSVLPFWALVWLTLDRVKTPHILDLGARLQVVCLYLQGRNSDMSPLIRVYGELRWWSITN
jgi:hypothetical protein